MKPTFSIVIPFYNTERSFYAKTFECLMGLPDGVAEVLVVDDGSRDASRDELVAYLSEVLPAATVLRKENGGQNSAIQLGVDQACGRYLLFLDSDDYLDQGCLMELAEYLEGESPDVVAFNHDVVSPEGRLLSAHELWDAGFHKASLQRLSLASDSLWRQCYCLQRLRELPFGLVQGILIGEDLSSAMSFNLALGDCVAYGGTLYHYVMRPTSMVNNPPAEVLGDILTAFDEVVDRCGPDYSGCTAEVEWMAILHVLAYGGQRAAYVAGDDPARKRALFDWMDDRFPSWRENRYLRTDPRAKELRYRLLIGGHWGAYLALRRGKDLLRKISALG